MTLISFHFVRGRHESVSDGSSVVRALQEATSDEQCSAGDENSSGDIGSLKNGDTVEIALRFEPFILAVSCACIHLFCDCEDVCLLNCMCTFA